MSQDDEPGLLAALVSDGRPPLAIVGVSLIFFGLFGLFLAVTGEFLPHDVRFLGVEPHEL